MKHVVKQHQCYRDQKEWRVVAVTIVFDIR